MGFLSFLAKLFGFGKSHTKGKLVASQAIEIYFTELPAFLKKECSAPKQEFEKRIYIKIAEVKHLLKTIKNQLQELDSVEPKHGVNDRMLKVFYTSKQQMSSRMNALLARLTVPETHDLIALKKYCEDSSFALRKGIFASGKSIAYTGFLLKDQVKFLGKTIEELDVIFVDLNKLFNESSVLMSFDGELAKFSELNEQIAEEKNKISAFEEQLKIVLQQLVSIEAALNDLNVSDDAKQVHAIEEELVKCNVELRELKNHATAILAKVERPLKKLQNFAEKTIGTLTKKQTTMLEYYLNDAFMALKVDLNARKLFFLLNRLKKLIEENSIEFNEKEKEKTIASINELLGMNFFEEFFWKENNLKKKLKQLTNEKNMFKIADKIRAKDVEKRLCEREIEGLKESIRQEKTVLNNFEQSLSSHKTALETSILKATNKNIEIKM